VLVVRRRRRARVEKKNWNGRALQLGRCRCLALAWLYGYGCTGVLISKVVSRPGHVLARHTADERQDRQSAAINERIYDQEAKRGCAHVPTPEG
jgi:hypothetical protein